MNLFKRLSSFIMCFAMLISFMPQISMVKAAGEETLTFFFVNSLQGSINFEYENPLDDNVNVIIKNETEVFYNKTHSLNSGKLALYGIPLEGEGKFELTVGNTVRKFHYLSEDYAENFPNVTVDEVKTAISSLDADGHPYLFGRKKTFADLSAKILSGSDEYLTKSYAEIKKTATSYLGKAPAPITTDISENSYISRGFNGWEIVMKCAFVYLIEGDEAYAERAYQEASYFASMTSWGTHQHIDNNQAAFAVALCYDWLYDWLGLGRRTELSEALREKHLDTIYDMYLNPSAPEYQITLYLHYYGASNHTIIDNSSVLIQALAIADLDKDYSANLIAGALQNLKAPIDTLAPDSIWKEGAGYWTFAGPFIARMLNALETSIGTTFGYINLPTVKNFGYFPIYQQSSQGRFIYSDNGEGVDDSPTRFYFAELCEDEGMQSYCLETSAPDPLLCIWYDPDKTYETTDAFQKDMLYRDGDTVSFRSTWEGENELFAAMAVSPVSRAKAFQNLGSFIIDALGEQWIKNPGRDSYSLPQYYLATEGSPRWTYYCTRAEANSCVVINPDLSGGQSLKSTDKIDGFDSGVSNAYAYADLTNTYPQVTSYKRGIQMYDLRRKVWLRDEIKLSEPGDVYSFINVYRSDIEITPDGAILKKGDKKMLVKIFSDADYSLRVMDAAPLPTSPNPEGQTDWTINLKRLAIVFDDTKEVNVDVVFVPFYGDTTPAVSKPNGTITEWSIDENSSSSLPRLDSISIDGKKLQNFDANVNFYNAVAQSTSPSITATSADGTVSVKKEGAYYHVTVTNADGISNDYVLALSVEGTVTADTVIGGGWSGGEYVVKGNYGSKADLMMRGLSSNSIMSYFKLDLGEIPTDKKVKKVTLQLNGYRWSNFTGEESLDFYLLDPDSWHEDTVSHYTAPLRHHYNYTGTTQPWYPVEELVNGEYVTRIYDAQVMKAFNKTVLQSASPSEEYYVTEEFDITELYEKNGRKSELSLAMLLSGGKSSYFYFASKEHSNEALRPKILIEYEEEKPTIDSISLDGTAIENFDSDINHYYVLANSLTPKITATSKNGEITVKHEKNYTKVTVTGENGASRDYFLWITIKRRVTADTFIGGSWSGDDYLVRNNYGAATELVMRGLSKWSLMSYFKLDIGDVPEGKKVKKVTLQLSGYRYSNYTGDENIDFYLLNPDSWQEDTVTHYNAPLRHYYDYNGTGEAWYPIEELQNGEYVRRAYDVQTTHTFNKTVSQNETRSEDYYVTEEFDVTELYKKNGEKSELSFAMLLSSGKSSYFYYASKEHANENLRPKILVEFEEDCETEITAYSNKEALVNIAESGTYVIVFADYENGKLKNIDVVEKELLAGTGISVSQNDQSFALGLGDKVILLNNMEALKPLCKALIIG